MRTLTVLMKPASSSCNMRCRYCFYHDVAHNRNQTNYGIMSEQTMKVVIDRAMSFAGAGGMVNFAFQGGEPTLCGREFFERFTAYVREAAVKVSCQTAYALQTNGLLIDDRFCELFAREGFLIGLSLDGPAEMHNRHRIDSAEKGTFTRVTEAARRLSKHKVPFNVLCVVTREQVRHPDKLYNFFQRQGFTHLQLLPCIEDFGQAGNRGQAPDVKDYGSFLCRIFDRWLAGWETGEPISIREFDNFVSLALFGAEPELCSLRGQCGANAIIVEADGSVYPCDFYVLDQWRLGSLLETGIDSLLAGEREAQFIHMSQRLPDACRQCEWLRWCRGGCRRLREPWSDEQPSLFRWCEAQLLFIPYALERMERLAAAIRRHQYRT